ncbi:peptidase M23 [Tenacibaculum discolor]|uniref:M23 family metallopeptidase n=1 Tax=Tenacibaculum discolor TaxID=361581 RepID=A0A2G1BQX9_9FLAO|nr:M23 family metallopeptidase [Tenacibaculum discolor]MDP2540944.1 M23 family metallopeptidase [Tenacibaculum discolor]PHN96446.1 peptidase M23 [Tenacibaculum discolor]PHO01351.1 peptidase M23 [Rhodobacteraceae bacterium 4F10]
MFKIKKKLLILLIILLTGFLIPQNLKMPVNGATKSDYNPKSFWYYPWGKSVTHKGVDIFAKKNTKITSSTYGLVLFSGKISMGGNIVVILGPKWRLHYYAHLEEVKTTSLTFVNNNSEIGTVGTSGNAVGKAPHLHYSILSLIPYVWKIDSDKQGWKKMFYLNPIDYLED